MRRRRWGVVALCRVDSASAVIIRRRPDSRVPTPIPDPFLQPNLKHTYVNRREFLAQEYEGVLQAHLLAYVETLWQFAIAVFGTVVEQTAREQRRRDLNGDLRGQLASSSGRLNVWLFAASS